MQCIDIGFMSKVMARSGALLSLSLSLSLSDKSSSTSSKTSRHQVMIITNLWVTLTTRSCMYPPGKWILLHLGPRLPQTPQLSTTTPCCWWGGTSRVSNSFACWNAPCWSFGRLQVLLFCLQLLPSHVAKSTTTQVSQHMSLHAANLHDDENPRSDSRIPISLYSSRFNPTATIWNWVQSASQWKPAERKIHVDLCSYIPGRQVAAAAGAQLPGRRWATCLWRPVVYLKPPPTCSNCGWVDGWEAVGECLPPFIHSFLPATTKESCRDSRLGLIWEKESDWIQGEEYEEWI